MTIKAIDDLNLLLAKRTIGEGSTPATAKSVSTSTGALWGPLTPGKYILKTVSRLYWKKGASTITGSGVLVDESTPETDVPLFAGESVVIIIEDTTNCYIAAKCNTTTLAWLIPCGDLSRQ